MLIVEYNFQKIEYPIAEIAPGQFVLQHKDHFSGLIDSLKKWAESNINLTKDEYYNETYSRFKSCVFNNTGVSSMASGNKKAEFVEKQNEQFTTGTDSQKKLTLLDFSRNLMPKKNTSQIEIADTFPNVDSLRSFVYSKMDGKFDGSFSELKKGIRNSDISSIHHTENSDILDNESFLDQKFGNATRLSGLSNVDSCTSGHFLEQPKLNKSIIKREGLFRQLPNAETKTKANNDKPLEYRSRSNSSNIENKFGEAKHTYLQKKTNQYDDHENLRIYDARSSIDSAISANYIAIPHNHQSARCINTQNLKPIEECNEDISFELPQIQSNLSVFYTQNLAFKNKISHDEENIQDLSGDYRNNNFQNVESDIKGIIDIFEEPNTATSNYNIDQKATTDEKKDQKIENIEPLVLPNNKILKLNENIIKRDSMISNASFYKSGEYFFTMDMFGYQKQWNTKQRSFSKDWGKIFSGMVDSMVISHDGRSLFIGARNGSMKEWQVKKNTITHDYGKIHKGAIYSIVCTQDCQNLFTGGQDRVQKHWDLTAKKLLNEFKDICNLSIRTMSFDEKSSNLFIGTEDGIQQKFHQVRSESGQDAQLTKSCNYEIMHEGPINKLAIDSYQDCVFTASDDMHIMKWQISENSFMMDFGDVHKDCIKTMCLTNSGKYLITASDDLNQKQWNLTNVLPELVVEIPNAHEDWIRTIQITPDDQFLLSSGEDMILKQWSIEENLRLVKDYGKSHSKSVINITIIP